MHIDDIVTIAHGQAVVSGFVKPGEARPVAVHVALMVTEIGELYEEERDGVKPSDLLYRHREAGQVVVNASPENTERTPGKPVGIAFELADLVIRAANFAGEHGIDLDRAIELKMAYNATRPHKHGRQS